MTSECIFCDIVNAETDTEILYETDDLVVFKDINPHAPVHLLLVPKKHIRSINDLSPEDNALVAALIVAGQHMAKQAGVAQSGYKLVFNVERGGGTDDISLASTPSWWLETLMNRNINLLLGGQLVSQVGDKFHMLAVAFLVLKTTGSPAKMGLILFCSVFPSMLLGLVSGTFIDRYNRKTIIIGADVARGLVVSGLAICYLLNALNFPLLLVAQVILSVCTAFFDPAIPAIIPQIVKSDQLTRANSQAQFISGLATVVGPTLGGMMVAWGGYLPVFLINAGSYLISAGFESFIKIPAIKRQARTETKILDDIRQGGHYVYIRNHLMVILIMVGIIHFFVGCIEVVIPILATNLVGEGAHNLGYLQTFFGLGMIMTALLLSIINIAGREARFLFGGVFGIGILMLLISLVYFSGVRGIVAFLILFSLIGGMVVIAGTSFRSILQKEVSADMMGRVFGFVAAVGNISIPLATLIFGILMSYVSHGILMAISGGVLLPTSLAAYHIFTRSNLAQASNQSMA